MVHLTDSLEGDQSGQSGSASYKALVTGPDCLTVLYMPCDDT